jgi:hypothetical protein
MKGRPQRSALKNSGLLPNSDFFAFTLRLAVRRPCIFALVRSLNMHCSFSSKSLE